MVGWEYCRCVLHLGCAFKLNWEQLPLSLLDLRIRQVMRFGVVYRLKIRVLEDCGSSGVGFGGIRDRAWVVTLIAAVT
jgi:hypothetical protein